MILYLALRKVRKRSLVLRGKIRRRAAKEGRAVGRASLLNVTWLELFCACDCESDGVGGNWRTCQPVNIKPQRTCKVGASRQSNMWEDRCLCSVLQARYCASCVKDNCTDQWCHPTIVKCAMRLGMIRIEVIQELRRRKRYN